MKKVLAFFCCIALVSLVIALIYFGPTIHQYFGTRYADADREIFKGTVTYNEGVLDDLSKYKYQYDNAEDDTERSAIASLVRSRFANFDKSRVENIDLLNFLKECGL